MTDTDQTPTTAKRGRKAQDDGQPQAEPTERKRAKAPDVSDVSLDAINGATLASAELIAAAAPQRERSEPQKAMDEVAKRAYQAWLDADKPSQWLKIPVVTYYLSEEDLPKYRYLIRRACAIVEPANGSPGVRVKFGNEFTLSEQMAEKIGRPNDAGKTVLAWAAVDKRTMEDKEGEES